MEEPQENNGHNKPKQEGNRQEGDLKGYSKSGNSPPLFYIKSVSVGDSEQNKNRLREVAAMLIRVAMTRNQKGLVSKIS